MTDSANNIVEIIDLDAPEKDSVRILVGQPHWLASDWKQQDLLYIPSNEEKFRLWLEAFFQKATQTKCDLVLLPELSVPFSLISIVTAWSKQTGIMVIGGSHYCESEEGFIAQSPVAYKGKCYFTEKIHPAPTEIAPIQGKGLRAGKILRVFKNSPVGKLGVLICSDYLKDSVKKSILKEGLDVLCILAFQNDSSRYHKRIDIDVDDQAKGLFVLYANNLFGTHGDGKSAAFGISDNLYRSKLISESQTDSSCESMLCKLRDEEDFFVVELDLRHKRPTQRRTVDARPNLTIIDRGSCYESAHVVPIQSSILAGSLSAKSGSIPSYSKHQELRAKVSEKVRKLVARHGLDDSEWMRAFSSMYFLVCLGRLLKIQQQEDYKNLLNQFLQFFNFNADDTLYLREDQVLVTPNENDRIRKCMEEEDARDPYFASSPKTRAGSVNAQLMHENYLYGVALGISAQENTLIMKAVRDTAIAHLVYRMNPSAQDAHGGWSPYRVPWITARILTSFSNVDLNQRVDKEHICSIMEKGLSSLIDRLQPDGFWRSGVGNWLSVWECTALCLEAFLHADNTKRFNSVIKAVLAQHLTDKPKWIERRPSFSSEEFANETLAATLMSSVIIRLINKAPMLSEQIPTGTEASLYSFLSDVLDEVSKTTKKEQRQFCTIPQIAAYCAAAVLED